MKEAIFSTEIVRSIRHHGGWAFKIPDMPITKELLKITRFTNAKPCDIVSTFNGQFVAIETKQFKKWEALGVRHFRPEQLSGMTDIVANGGRAFVFLNIRIKADKIKKLMAVNRLLVFDWSTWGPRIMKRSIFAESLRQRPHYDPMICPKGKIIFDLTEWVEYL